LVVGVFHEKTGRAEAKERIPGDLLAKRHHVESVQAFQRRSHRTLALVARDPTYPPRFAVACQRKKAVVEGQA